MATLMQKRFLTAAIALVALAWIPFDPGDNPLWNMLFDFGHFPALAVLTWLIYSGLRRAVPDARRRAIQSGLIAAGVAVAVELIQPFVGRTASFRDGWTGLLGVLVAVSAIAVWRPGATARSWRAAQLTASVLLGALCFWLPFVDWQSAQWRYTHLPLIADFEHRFEEGLWEPYGGTRDTPTLIERSTELAASGEYALRVTTGSGSWAQGVTYDAGGLSWDTFDVLTLSVYNTGPSVTLIVMVLDDLVPGGTRSPFVRKPVLDPGWNTLQFSIDDVRQGNGSEPLDLTDVRQLFLGTPEAAPPGVFFVDDVRPVDTPLNRQGTAMLIMWARSGSLLAGRRGVADEHASG